MAPSRRAAKKKAKAKAGRGAIAHCFAKFLHPRKSVIKAWPNNWSKMEVKRLNVLSCKHRPIRNGNAPTWTLTMSHADADCELYSYIRYVKIDKEGPDTEIFNMCEDGVQRNIPRQVLGNSAQSPTSNECANQHRNGEDTENEEEEEVGLDGPDHTNEHDAPLVLPTSAGNTEEEGQRNTLSQSDIDELRRAGVVVDDETTPAPENVPSPSSGVGVSGRGTRGARRARGDATDTEDAEEVLDYGFDGVDQWRQKGHNTLHKTKMRGISADRMEHMSMMDMFLVFFPTSYIKEVVIVETNKKLHHPMSFGEFLRFIGCWLMMSCYEGITNRRDWWSTKTISMHEGAPFRLNEWMSRSRFEEILRYLQYTNMPLPSFNDPYFHRRQMEEAWNKNMCDIFDPSWVSVLDESMQIWFNRWTCPGWMYVARKPHPFGNELHTIACALSGILFFAEMVEGKDRPRQLGKKQFAELGKTVGLMLRMSRPLWGTGKVVVMDSGFCVAKGLCEMYHKGVYGHALIKKRRYWPTSVPGDKIDEHMENSEVGEVDALKRKNDGVDWHVFCMKEPEYVMKIMTTYGTLDPKDDAETKRTVDDGGTKKKVKFKYTEVFKNHFKYRHFVDDHNNRRHGSGMSIERTWGTQYWPDRSFAWFLAVSEVNTNLARSFFLHGVGLLPQVVFRKKLAFELLLNNFDIDESAVAEHNLRSNSNKDHSLKVAPHYTGKWLSSKNLWNKVKSKYQKQLCAYQMTGCKNLTRLYCTCSTGLFICTSCYPKHIIDHEMA